VGGIRYITLAVAKRMMMGKGRQTRQKKHLPFVDGNVLELALVDNLQQHGALVLVEPLGRLVDVVVVAGIRAANYLSQASASALYICIYVYALYVHIHHMCIVYTPHVYCIYTICVLYIHYMYRVYNTCV
jgi:hypothetical protein